MKETMLIFIDTVNNNNKFYHVTLDGTKVTKRWGRVGQDGTSNSDQSGESGYERAINAKKRKGYTEAAIEGTERSAAQATEENLSQVAYKYLAADPSDTQIISLIDRLISYNQHQIMEQSGGQIKVNDNGVLTTALGVVSLSTLARARKALDSLQKNNPIEKKRSILEEYLKLIPQPVNFRTQLDSWFTKEKYESQLDFIQQLEASVQFSMAQQTTQEDETDTRTAEEKLAEFSDLFRMQISMLDDEKEFKRISKLFEKSKNSRHSSSNMKLKNVYVITDRKGVEAFEEAKAKYGNVRELWHGTKVANVLSILKSGLFVPALNSGIQIAGRMFGNGVYLSDQSTKSLNYATGMWGGPNMRQNCFMLLTTTVMGNEFRPKYWDHTSPQHAHTGVDRDGNPYQSISVKGGTCRVLNNEMIVWNTDQIQISYLCEFSE